MSYPPHVHSIHIQCHVRNDLDVLFICIILSVFVQRAILKFARYTGAHPIAGRFTPGTFTNQIQAAFREPRILVVSDPRADHQVFGYVRYSQGQVYKYRLYIM